MLLLQLVAVACLYLGCKVQESPKYLRDVIKVAETRKWAKWCDDHPTERRKWEDMVSGIGAHAPFMPLPGLTQQANCASSSKQPLPARLGCASWACQLRLRCGSQRACLHLTLSHPRARAC